MESEKSLELVPEVQIDALEDGRHAFNVKEAFKRLPEKDQKEVLALADQIDVTKMENVMAYGSNILIKTFNQCRKLS